MKKYFLFVLLTSGQLFATFYNLEITPTDHLLASLGCSNSGGNPDSIVPLPSIKEQMEMVFVEGGTYMMGSNSGEFAERPAHKVTVNGFYIGKYEISQEFLDSIYPTITLPDYPVEVKKSVHWQYSYYMLCNQLSVIEGLMPAYTIITKPAGKKENPQGGTLIVSVTCDFKANGYRLPTEAEWEFAARGGNKSKGYLYSGSDNLQEVGWFELSYEDYFARPGLKNPNELGLYDMSGGQYEYCWDFYAPYSKKTQDNPTGPSTGNEIVIRGGSIMDFREGCTVTARRGDSPTRMFAVPVSFRLARSK